MTPDDVKDVVADIRWMTVEQGRAITTFIHEHGIRSILELGFHHGVSTCYLAAALDAAGGGSLTTIDLEHTRNFMEENYNAMLEARTQLEALTEKSEAREKALVRKIEALLGAPFDPETLRNDDA